MDGSEKLERASGPLGSVPFAKVAGLKDSFKKREPRAGRTYIVQYGISDALRSKFDLQQDALQKLKHHTFVLIRVNCSSLTFQISNLTRSIHHPYYKIRMLRIEIISTKLEEEVFYQFVLKLFQFLVMNTLEQFDSDF